MQSKHFAERNSFKISLKKIFRTQIRKIFDNPFGINSFFVLIDAFSYPFQFILTINLKLWQNGKTHYLSYLYIDRYQKGWMEKDFRASSKFLISQMFLYC